jgi:hypothetical protein
MTNDGPGGFVKVLRKQILRFQVSYRIAHVSGLELWNRFSSDKKPFNLYAFHLFV